MLPAGKVTTSPWGTRTAVQSRSRRTGSLLREYMSGPGPVGRGPAGRFRADGGDRQEGGGAPPCKAATVSPRGRYAVRLSSRRLPKPPDFLARACLPPFAQRLVGCPGLAAAWGL